MKLSRTAWNNIIIFSVMIFILVINVTDDKLFSEQATSKGAFEAILPLHSIVLTMEITLPGKQEIRYERIGRHWKLTTRGLLFAQTDQQIEQMMMTWQQSKGLIQAGNLVIQGDSTIAVEIAVAGKDTPYNFMLYALHDQLLVNSVNDKRWLALPQYLTQQLIPNSQ